MIEFTPKYIPLDAEARARFTPAGERWFHNTFGTAFDRWGPLRELIDALSHCQDNYVGEFIEGVYLRPKVPDRPLTGAEMNQIYALKVNEVVEELNHRLLQQREERKGVLRIDLCNLPYGEHVGADALQNFRIAGWDVVSGAGSREMLFDPPDEVVGPPAEKFAPSPDQGPTCAENELEEAWAATGVAGQVRGVTTLADVVTNLRSDVVTFRSLKAVLLSLADSGENFRPGDVEDMGAWINRTVRRLRDLANKEPRE